MEVEVAEGSFWAPLVFLALVFDHFAIESCSHNGIDGRARAMIWLNSSLVKYLGRGGRGGFTTAGTEEGAGLLGEEETGVFTTEVTEDTEEGGGVVGEES